MKDKVTTSSGISKTSGTSGLSSIRRSLENLYFKSSMEQKARCAEELNLTYRTKQGFQIPRALRSLKAW